MGQRGKLQIVGAALGGAGADVEGGAVKRRVAVVFFPLPAVAGEALRVVLLRLRAGKLDQPDSLAGFLRGTALNLLANELRRSERRLADASSDWMDQIVGESSDPYDTVESDDLVQNMREVISGMKVERDRELLWRYYVDEDPKDRLCAQYELSPEHFDRVLHRARGRLKELWQSHGRATPGGPRRMK